jgi:hypothetical protein
MTIEASVRYGDCAVADPRLESDKPVDSQLKTDSRRIAIHDARPLCDQLSLDREGFVLRNHRAFTPFEPAFIPFNLVRKRDLPPINRRYAEEMIPLIAELCGADQIVPQAGRVTVRATPRTRLATSDGTATLVHLDYTPTAVRDAIELTFRLAGKAVPTYRRVAVIQTWRPLVPPPHDSLLAICDAQSVSIDATTILQTYTPGEGDQPEHIEVRLCAFEASHRWYYFSDMQPDELLIFKGYDSAFAHSASGAHVAFDNPAAVPQNGRISVEARYLAFYH